MTFFPDWPSGAVATFAASALAAAVALVSIVTTLVDGAMSRRRSADTARREQWWGRWSFTVDRALSDDTAQKRIGATLLRVLVEIPSATEEDRRVAKAVADALTEPSPSPKTEEENHGPRGV